MARNSHLIAGRTREARKAVAAAKTGVSPSKKANTSQFIPGTRLARGQKGANAGRPRPRDLLECSGAVSQAKPPVKVSIRRAIHEAVKESRGDSSSEEELDVVLASEDPDLLYSFDANASPSYGGHVLSAAVVRAVDKFETKQTEKLVREYEFVGAVDPDDFNEGYGGYDDGFELIEPVDY